MNDSAEHAAELAELLAGRPVIEPWLEDRKKSAVLRHMLHPLTQVNLIPYNAFEGGSAED